MSKAVSRWAFILGCATGLLLGGCNSGNIRSFKSNNDTSQLTEAEIRTWHLSKEIDAYFRDKGLLYPSPQLNAYLQGIAEQMYPEFKGNVHIRLINHPDLNAFCLANGSVYVSVGLLARLRNEAQIATVIGHEIAHFTEQHVLKSTEAANTLATTGMLIAIAGGISPQQGQLLGGMLRAAIAGYSREHEREADKLGFDHLVKSGYDPREATGAFKLLLEEAEIYGGEHASLYASHPRLTERIASFEELAAPLPVEGTKRNTEDFTRRTQGLREVVLDRYLKTRRYKTLILILENRSLRLRYPDHADFYLAEAYRQRGEDGDAILAEHAYRKAITLAPKYAPSQRGLGLLLMPQKGRSSEALKHFEQYLAMSPDAADRGYIRNYIAKLKE